MTKKIFSVLLAIALILSTLSVSFCIANADKTITVFSQTDSRWGSHQYGYSNTSGTEPATISSGGCGILAYVNAVYYLTGNFIEPIELADYSVRNGHRQNGVGTKNSLYKAFADSDGSKYGFMYDSTVSGYSSLKSKLQSGKVAICHQPGHLMALVDYNDTTGKYLLLDSFKSSYRGTYNGGYAWKTQSELQTLRNSSGENPIDSSWFIILASTNATPVISQSWETDPSNGSFFDLNVSATFCTYIDYTVKSVNTGNIVKRERINSSSGVLSFTNSNPSNWGNCFQVTIMPNGISGLKDCYVTYGNPVYYVTFPKIESSISVSQNSINLDLFACPSTTVYVSGTNYAYLAFGFDDESICSAQWGDYDESHGGWPCILTAKKGGTTNAIFTALGEDDVSLCSTRIPLVVSGAPQVRVNISSVELDIKNYPSITIYVSGTNYAHVAFGFDDESICSAQWGGYDESNGGWACTLTAKKSGATDVIFTALDENREFLCDIHIPIVVTGVPEIRVNATSIELEKNKKPSIIVYVSATNYAHLAFGFDDDSICSAQWGDYDESNGGWACTLTAKKSGTTNVIFTALDENNEFLCDIKIPMEVFDSYDTTTPKGSITVTNNVATTQTVTIKMSDNDELAGYYWGTDSSLTPSFTSISGTEKTVTKTVSSVGTYYLTVKDKTGNTYQTSVVFVKLHLNANGGSVSPVDIVLVSGDSVTLPKADRNDCTFLGWYDSPETDKFGLPTGNPYSNKTQQDMSLYAIWTDDSVLRWGDLNKDGEINMLDIIKLNKYICGKESCDAFQAFMSDVNADGRLTIDENGDGNIDENSDVYLLNLLKIGKINFSDLPAYRLFEGIAVYTKPQTKYTYGESFSVEGLSIVAKYSNGVQYILEDNFTVTGYDPYKVGNQKVQIHFFRFTTTLDVTVQSPDWSVDLSFSTKTMKIGDTLQIIATTKPSDRTVIWKSSNSDIATVINGAVTAKAVGTAIITAEFSYNGTVYKDECIIEVEAGFQLGDVNNDGVVNAKDRIDLTRYLAHWEDYPESTINMEAADVNCDGVVNAKDRIDLTRYLAHWSGYESLPVKLIL